MSQIHTQWSHFWRHYNVITMVTLLEAVLELLLLCTYILMLLLAFYCTYCAPTPFCILCTCPKSCFGGLDEQSGYLVSLLLQFH